MWDLFVMGLVLSGGNLIKIAKSHMRSTCQKLKCQVPAMEVEESCASYAAIFATQSTRQWPTKNTSLRIFECDLFSHHLYYIYPHYPQKWQRAYWEKNPKKGFYNTTTLLERELLILREKSLQSLLIHFPIVIPIEKIFVPKHNPHPFRVLRVFLELRKHWKMPRMADAIWS